MRILVVHTWLKGNLGDVLQASVLLRGLRALDPEVLDLCGHPRNVPAQCLEVTELADRYRPEGAMWWWRGVPAGFAAPIRRWGPRGRLFARYDVVVSAPGAFLADYDARCAAALLDFQLDSRCVVAAQSIGPLEHPDALRRVSACVVREPASHAYLAGRGIGSTSAADLGFLYPFEPSVARGGQGTAVFLRSNNLDLDRVTLRGGVLREGDRTIADVGDAIVLATSDARRDRTPLAALGRRLGWAVRTCERISELVDVVFGADAVVTDRYHPAVCAAAMGVSCTVLPTHETHKMTGLQTLMGEYDADGLRGMAQAGLAAIQAAVA